MHHSRWTILAVLFTARAFMGWQFQSLGALSALVVGDLGIDYARLGSLIGFYMLPGIFIALPGGLLGQRFGSKRVVIVALLLMAVGGALMGFGSSFASMAAGRLIAGLGAAILNVLLTKMAADWFAGRELALAMAILVAAWPFGIGTALVTCLPLALHAAWPVVMEISAVGALACGALVALLYREPPGVGATVHAGFRIELTRREWQLASLAGLVWATYNVAYIVLVTFMPDFFVSRGYVRTDAATVASGLGWLLIPCVPLGGAIAERWRKPNLLIGGCCAIVAALVAILPVMSSLFGAFIVIAIGFGLPAGCIVALPAGVLRPQARGSGMGVFFSWYYVGMALLPGLAGLARDLTSDAAAPLLVAAAFMIVALGFLVAFRLRVRMAVAAA